MARKARKERAVSHQTTRLGVGKHVRPGAVVCVMELASMLAGERFSDRPVSVCPVIGSILRTYNDNVGDDRRDDLYRYAAEAVGTRGNFSLQLQRGAAAVAWAQARAGRRSQRWVPQPDCGPDLIAEYVIASLGRIRSKRSTRRGWSQATHVALLELVDELIALGTEPLPELPAVVPTPGAFEEHLTVTVEEPGCAAAEAFAAPVGVR